MTESTARSIRAWARKTVADRWTAVVIAAVFVMLGVYPGPSLLLLRDPAWKSDVIVSRLADERAYWIAGALVIVGPAVVLGNMLAGPFDRVWTFLHMRVRSLGDQWFVLGTAIFAAGVAAGAAMYVLARKPTTSDEVAQLWHARILLSGRLWLPPDPNPEFFAIDNVIDRGRWYSQFPIGGPAVFALAMGLHATWLLNPLLTGLTVANVYRFASRAYGADEARVGAILCAVCPFLLLMGASYMNHTVVICLATLALAELPMIAGDGASRRRIAAAVTIGLALGAAIAVRPLDGAIATLAIGGTLLVVTLRQRRIALIVAAALGGAVPIAALLIVNSVTTGRPLLFGYEVLWGANHSLGFHADPSGNPHTPARGVALAVGYLMQLNWSLFEWPIAGLFIVAIALIAIGRLRRWDVVLLVWIGSQVVAYASYWHAGNFLGPRYLVTVVPAFLLIVARGLVVIAHDGTSAMRRTAIVVVASSVVSTWAISSSTVGARGFAETARGVRASFKADLEPAVRSLAGAKALVFVREPASARLMRLMWGLSISRPDAARLVATKDHCALLDIVLDTATQAQPMAERLARLKAAKSYAPPVGWRLMVNDVAFRTSDRESITPRCRTELLTDANVPRVISYGSALLLNTIGSDGRVAGPIVFVADLGEHNEVLRRRFGDRPWYRLDFVDTALDAPPELVPYR